MTVPKVQSLAWVEYFYTLAKEELFALTLSMKDFSLFIKKLFPRLDLFCSLASRNQKSLWKLKKNFLEMKVLTLMSSIPTSAIDIYNRLFLAKLLSNIYL
jgi:hypothetical protein